MKAAGIILLIIGIAMMIVNGINYTTKEEVADIGPLEINKEEEHSIGWPMYAGGIVAVGGIILIVAGRRRK